MIHFPFFFYFIESNFSLMRQRGQELVLPAKQHETTYKQQPQQRILSFSTSLFIQNHIMLGTIQTVLSNAYGTEPSPS